MTLPDKITSWEKSEKNVKYIEKKSCIYRNTADALLKLELTTIFDNQFYFRTIC